jgi:hypothetical protein
MSRFPHSGILAPFIIYGTIHTISVLLIDQTFVQMQPGPMLSAWRLRVAFRLWSNIRRLNVIDSSTGRSIKDERMMFAIRRICHATAMWLLHQLLAALTARALQRIQVTSHDFTLPNQGVIPLLATRDLCIRGVVSVN